jgi:hypothetical protein
MSNLLSAFLSWSECYALRLVYTKFFRTNNKRARKFTGRESQKGGDKGGVSCLACKAGKREIIS